METTDLLTLLGGGGIVAIVLRWIKTSGWLTLIPDRQLAPGTSLRSAATLGLAVVAAFGAGYWQDGTLEAGVISISGALSTHSAVFGATALGSLVDRAVPAVAKRVRK